MFKDKLKDLGSIKANSTYNVVFLNTDYKNDIVQVRASCGCSNAKLNRETGNVEVKYKPDSVPYHLLQQGYYTTSKYITVVYNNGESEILTIKANVYDR